MKELEKKFMERNEFYEAAKPLMEYLAKNYHPHVQVLVNSDTAELVESLAMVKTDQFIRD